MDPSFRLGPDGIYRCQAFQQFIWQTHGFGTRRANPIAGVTLRQIHSDLVRNAHGLSDREEEGDALVTNDIALAIGVRTADCVPILLLDTRTKAIAAIHAGWRGTAAEIVGCAIHKMATEFDSVPADLMAAIGPCIRECCYEVGAEVVARFESAVPEWRDTTVKPGGKRNLDLARVNMRQMRFAGLQDDHIFDSCLCTCCQIQTFYSYRSEPNEPGRLTSAITRLS